ncbi:MAG: PilN domain-containing protein [Bacteroidia bacterium]
MKKFIDQILAAKTCTGVEILLRADAPVFRLMHLQRSGNQVKPLGALQEFQTLDDLVMELKSGVPVVLVFSGKGVLHRTVAQQNQADDARYLNLVLPNANANEFLVQHVSMQAAQEVVSVVRRELVDEWMAKISGVVALSIGPFAFAALGLQNDASIETAGLRLQFADKTLEAWQISDEPETEKIAIGGESISGKALPVFGAACGYFLGLDFEGHAHHPALTQAQDDFKQQHIFRVGGLALLGISLIVLLVNYFAFSHFWEKKSELEQQLSVRGDALKRVQQLEKKTAERRIFLERSGLIEKAHQAWNADQLALKLPKSLRLTRMNLSPRQRTANADTIAFQPRHIDIVGTTEQSTDLNEWIRLLNTMPWISRATLVNYNRLKGESRSEFSVSIDVKTAP